MKNNDELRAVLSELNQEFLVASQTASEDADVQFFAGFGQVKSIDGTMPYGQPYDAVCMRIVDKENGLIVECVNQQGGTFIATLSSTDDPLIYDVNDGKGTYTGTITFEDDTLSSWSYNIDVSVPEPGKLTGSRPEKGANIDMASGHVSVAKTWNDTVLLIEELQAIDLGQYKAVVERAQNPVSSPA